MLPPSSEYLKPFRIDRMIMNPCHKALVFMEAVTRIKTAAL
jgi:hypothetical protein